MFPWKASDGMVNLYSFPTYAVESGMPHSRVKGSLPVRVSAASRPWYLRAWPWTWATHTVTTTNTVIHLVSNSISIVTGKVVSWSSSFSCSETWVWDELSGTWLLSLLWSLFSPRYRLTDPLSQMPENTPKRHCIHTDWINTKQWTLRRTAHF